MVCIRNTVILTICRSLFSNNFAIRYNFSITEKIFIDTEKDFCHIYASFCYKQLLNRFWAQGPFRGPFVSVGTPSNSTIGGHTGLFAVGTNTRNQA